MHDSFSPKTGKTPTAVESCSCETPVDFTVGATARRTFLKWGTAAVPVLMAPTVWAGTDSPVSAETYAQELYTTLTADQKKVVALPLSDTRRHTASANWKITEPKIADLSTKQQEIVERILKSATSEDGFKKFKDQTEDDSGGLDEYHIAFFGKPGDKGFQFAMTGRHMTMRMDGNFEDGIAFTGPMVYGHQGPSGDPESPDHRGNDFWYQALQANEVFKALDPKQREVALVTKAPKESSITHRKSGYPGLCVGAMSSDQQSLVDKVIRDLLSPYREKDVTEAMNILKANGGIGKLHLSFYQQGEDGKSGDLGNDKVWDIWRLEGPGFVWHFRGAPHVHTWVNIARV